jgi:hypothetical protein
MPKLRVEDKCELSPRLKVTGVPDPQRIFSLVKEVLIMRCRLKEDDINEKIYEHDKSTVPEKIHAFIEAYKHLDRYSDVVLEITMDFVLKPVHREGVEYVGDAKVKIEGFVRTEYPQDSILQKSILWNVFRTFYEKAIYGDIRGNMMDLCRSFIKKVTAEINNYFKLKPRMA